MEPEDVLLVTDGVKDVIDGIVHEMEFGIYLEAFFMVWQEVMYSLSCQTQRKDQWTSQRG